MDCNKMNDIPGLQRMKPTHFFLQYQCEVDISGFEPYAG